MSNIRSVAGAVNALPNSVDFLLGLNTEKVHLCAIHSRTKGLIRGRTFPKTEASRRDINQWIDAHQKQFYGVYFYCNDLGIELGKSKREDGKVIVKANEAEVTHVCALHADCDPDPKTPFEKIKEVKAALLVSARAQARQTNIIIDSGGGLGCFAVLTDRVPVNDENRENLRLRNKAFVRDICDPVEGAKPDSCWNLDRVMRVPYTTNFPSPAKIARGRKKAPAFLEDDFGFDTFDVTQFRVAEPDDAKPKKGKKASNDNSAAGEYARIGSPAIPDKVDLATLTATLQRWIEKGESGKRKIGDGSRSDLIYHVACEMRRREFTDGQILAVITNPNYAISDHYTDQGQRPIEDQASRVILAMNEAGVIAESNKRFPWDDEAAVVIFPPAFVHLKGRATMSDKSFDKRFGWCCRGEYAHKIATIEVHRPL